MKIYNKKDKSKNNYWNNIFLGRTPITVPLITCDFSINTGVKIKNCEDTIPILEYNFTGEFYNENEFNEFLKQFNC